MTTLASPPSPAGSAGGGRTRFLDRPVRNTVLAVASLLVIVATVLFLTGSQGSTSVSFKVTSYSTSTSDMVVIYGMVGLPTHAKRAHVEVYSMVSGRMHVLGRTSPHSGGVYQITLTHFTRTLRLHLRVGGTRYHGTVSFRAHPGRAYGIYAWLVRHNSVFFLPVNSY